MKNKMKSQKAINEVAEIKKLENKLAESIKAMEAETPNPSTAADWEKSFAKTPATVMEAFVKKSIASGVAPMFDKDDTIVTVC